MLNIFGYFSSNHGFFNISGFFLRVLVATEHWQEQARDSTKMLRAQH